VPIPWSGTAPPFGFSPAGATAAPWLPQPATWRDRTVEAESNDPDSMLALYRRALRQRRGRPELGDGPFAWLPGPDRVLVFSRGQDATFACVVNLSDEPVALPVTGAVVLTSGPLDGDRLPPDTSAWVVMD
jgi:alpha-glucosidase